MKTKAINTLIIAGLAIGGALGLSSCAYQNTSPEQACTVQDKAVTIASKQTQYKVWTDCGVFVIEDSFVHGTWNSADLYGRIEKGHTYELETYGPRNGFFSLFPNIVSIQEVSK